MESARKKLPKKNEAAERSQRLTQASKKQHLSDRPFFCTTFIPNGKSAIAEPLAIPQIFVAIDSDDSPAGEG